MPENINPSTIPLARVTSRNVKIYLTDESESGWVEAGSFLSISFDANLNLEYYTYSGTSRKKASLIVPDVSGTLEEGFVSTKIIKKFIEMFNIDCGEPLTFTIVLDICFPAEQAYHRVYIRNVYLPTLSISGGEAANYGVSIKFENGFLEVQD